MGLFCCFGAEWGSASILRAPSRSCDRMITGGVFWPRREKEQPTERSPTRRLRNIFYETTEQ
jgi:hypothetical protein